MILVAGKFAIDIMEPIIDKNFSHLRLYKNIFYTPLIISKINAHIVLRAIIKMTKYDVAAESLNSLSLQW